MEETLMEKFHYQVVKVKTSILDSLSKKFEGSQLGAFSI